MIADEPQVGTLTLEASVFSLDCLGNYNMTMNVGGFLGGADGKEPAYQYRRQKRCTFDPWIGKIRWRRKWQPTPVFLLEKSHEQRSLAAYSLWSRTQLNNNNTMNLKYLIPGRSSHIIDEMAVVVAVMVATFIHQLLLHVRS